MSENKMQFDPTKIGFAEELGHATQFPAIKNDKQTAKKPTSAEKVDAIDEIPTDIDFSGDMEDRKSVV